MKINMTDKEKNQYIETLELQLSEALEKKLDVSILMKTQQEFLINKYSEKDILLSEIKHLNDEINNLNRTIFLDRAYIDCLLNSRWWKISFPFRIISRKIKNKLKPQPSTYEFLKDITKDDEYSSLDVKVSVIITTYNAGKEFGIQLSNLRKQKLIKELDIIVLDRGSTDCTIELAKKEHANIINIKDLALNDSEVYEKCLPQISGDYVVLIDQNKVVDSDYWIYQAIRPIEEDQAIITAFFSDKSRKDADEIKDLTCYPELKQRICSLAKEKVIFLPKSRDNIQYINTSILEKSCIIVKKKISNMRYI